MVQNRDAYFSGGVQKVRIVTPMLGGVHFFLCFSCSVALPFLTFSTPPLPECLFCYWGDGLAFSCSVALTFFCASHARWRCDFQLLQPLYGANACFATGVTDWRSHAPWRSHFFVLLMLGGVAIFTFRNPSTARMLLLLMERQMCMSVPSMIMLVTLLRRECLYCFHGHKICQLDFRICTACRYVFFVGVLTRYNETMLV
jgi:hypothetical protein